MNFLGMGTLEIIIVLLVAFLFLGPERMIGVARMLGKMVREVRRMTAELPDLIMEEEERARQTEAPIIHRGGGPNPGTGGNPSASQASTNNTSGREDEAPASEDGPVPFQRPNQPQSNPDPPSKQESA